MTDDESGTSDAQLAILAELLQVEISVSTVVVALEHAQKHPAAVAALRDQIWLEFGVGGV